MRNLIVKYFALNYITKYFGEVSNFPRAATFIYPLMVITGLLVTMGMETFWVVLFSTLLAMSIFLGFVYFRIYPIKFEELDIEQKWMYNQALEKKEVIGELSESQMREVIKASEYMTSKVFNPDVKFYKPFFIFYNPVIISLIVFFIAWFFLK